MKPLADIPALRCSCKDLRKSYGGLTVLDGCALSVTAGEIVGLVGENGSGKTTLVRCLLGFERLASGTVHLHPSHGYCPQEDYLNPRLTAGEHLRFLARIYRQDHAMDQEFSNGLVDRLKLGRYLNVLISRLSGGTYQKLKFVTAVLHAPALAILDEPTDGFDWAMYGVFWEIIEELKRTGSSVLMVSHLLHERERYNKIYALKEGHLEQVQ